MAAQNNLNRYLSAFEVVQAYEDQVNEGLELDADRVLDAQRRLMDAQLQYFSSRTEYAVALKNVHFEKGSLMAYTQVGILDESAATMGFADHDADADTYVADADPEEHESSPAWVADSSLLQSTENDVTFATTINDVTEVSDEYELDSQQAGRVSFSVDDFDHGFAQRQQVAPTAAVASESDRVEPLFVAPPARDAPTDVSEASMAGKVRVDLEPAGDMMPAGFILDLDTFQSFEPATNSP